MSRTAEVNIVCDGLDPEVGCPHFSVLTGEPGTYKESLAHAKAQAGERGWMTRDELDLCAHCWAASKLSQGRSESASVSSKTDGQGQGREMPS